MGLRPKIRLAVLASGSGSNLQAILDACRSPVLGHCEVALVISNKPGSFALDRAERADAEALFIDPKIFSSRSA